MKTGVSTAESSAMSTHAARARRLLLLALPLALMVEPLVAAALVLGIGILPDTGVGRGGRTLRALVRGWSGPVAGILVAGLLAAASAVIAGGGSGPVTTWTAWLGAAGALMILTSRLGPDDASTVTVGSAMAAVTGLGLSLRQTIWLGESQATLFTFHPNLAAAAMLVTTAGLLVGWRSAWRRSSLLGRTALVLCLAAALVTVVLTGSRSGVVGLGAGTVVWMALALPRARPRPLLFVATGVTVAVGAAWVVDRSLAGEVTPNLIVNSGFEYGWTPWTTSDAAQRVASRDGFALRLTRPTSSTWRFVSYVPQIRAPENASLRFAISVRPGSSGEASPPVYVALDAFDADGEVTGRLGVDGWTLDGVHTVGGRPLLPGSSSVSPTAATTQTSESEPGVADPAMLSTPWQRYSFVVPPAPPGTAWLHLDFVSSGTTVGPYGWVDDVSLVLEPHGIGDAGAVVDRDVYVPGPRPSLRTWLSPATQRLRELTDLSTAEGGRVAMWLLGLEVAAARPVLGYGLGMEGEIAQMYAHEAIRRTLQHFHSFYLRVLIEGGSVLLATVLVLIVRLWSTFARAALARRPGALAASALLVALLVQSVFDPVLNFAAIVGGLWLVGAVSDSGSGS